MFDAWLNLSHLEKATAFVIVSISATTINLVRISPDANWKTYQWCSTKWFSMLLYSKKQWQPTKQVEHRLQSRRIANLSYFHCSLDHLRTRIPISNLLSVYLLHSTILTQPAFVRQCSWDNRNPQPGEVLWEWMLEHCDWLASRVEFLRDRTSWRMSLGGRQLY